MKRIILSFCFVLASAGVSFAVGEYFKVEMTGTEYCGDYQFQQFNASNNVDIWMTVVANDEIIASLTPDFESGTTFPVYLTYYTVGKNKTAFAGGVMFNNGAWISVFGKSSLDRNRRITSIQGTFTQDGVLRPYCFSTGTFRTSKP